MQFCRIYFIGYGAHTTVLAVLLSPYLSGRGDWSAVFAIGSGFCLVAAALWLFVRADHRFA